MLSDAMKFWDSISGKVKQLITGETQNAFRCERYEVSTAPNGSVIGVRKPFGAKELLLPYSAEVSSAAVGDPVLVVWWGSMSNAKVYYMANGFKGSDAGSGDFVLKTGDTMTGPLVLRQGTYVYQSDAGGGSAGYIKMATIQIKRAYCNAPITILYTRRGDSVATTLTLAFANSASLDPSIRSFTTDGNNLAAYIAKGSTSTWDLYIQKAEAYDSISVLGLFWGPYIMSGVTLTWVGEFASALPSGATQASSSVLTNVYPVGSVYVSMEKTSPASLFGGTWTQIENRFLYAAPLTATSGTTGGSSTHNHTTGNATLTLTQIPRHTHTVSITKTTAGYGGTIYNNYLNSQYSGDGTQTYTSSATGGNQNGTTAAHNHGNTGDANHTPPYFMVYAWYRVS